MPRRGQSLAEWARRAAENPVAADAIGRIEAGLQEIASTRRGEGARVTSIVRRTEADVWLEYDAEREEDCVRIGDGSLGWLGSESPDVVDALYDLSGGLRTVLSVESPALYAAKVLNDVRNRQLPPAGS